MENILKINMKSLFALAKKFYSFGSSEKETLKVIRYTKPTFNEKDDISKTAAAMKIYDLVYCVANPQQESYAHCDIYSMLPKDIQKIVEEEMVEENENMNCGYVSNFGEYYNRREAEKFRGIFRSSDLLRYQ